MKILTLLFAVLLLAQTPASQNCPGGMMGGQGTMMQGMHGMHGMRGAADHAYMQSMMAMHEGLRSQTMTGDADHDFMTMMIPHHQAAVDMAKTELKYGKNPKLRAMARQIIETQEAEIHQMRAMLH